MKEEVLLMYLLKKYKNLKIAYRSAFSSYVDCVSTGTWLEYCIVYNQFNRTSYPFDLCGIF